MFVHFTMGNGDLGKEVFRSTVAEARTLAASPTSEESSPLRDALTETVAAFGVTE